jgi:hypothetical protein
MILPGVLPRYKALHLKTESPFWSLAYTSTENGNGPRFRGGP